MDMRQKTILLNEACTADLQIPGRAFILIILIIFIFIFFNFVK